jgi:hypothetical protein
LHARLVDGVLSENSSDAKADSVSVSVCTTAERHENHEIAIEVSCPKWYSMRLGRLWSAVSRGRGHRCAEIAARDAGVVKIFLVIEVLRKKRWAYPAAMVVLIAFIAYQVYRFSLSRSIEMFVLTIFDSIVLALLWREYKQTAKPKRGAVAE